MTATMRLITHRTKARRTLRTVAQHLVGGVNSPVRAFRQTGGVPVILSRAKGAEVVDAAGQKFVDFILGWGALPFGHNDPAVIRALRAAMGKGAPLGLTHPAEAELAQRIVEAVPSVEQVRFTVSGTEACMTAVKLARAHTGRPKLLAFEGCYHGHGDSLMAGLPAGKASKTAGIPEAVAKNTLRVPFNDLASVEDALTRDGHELACVIIEPVAANMGVVPPEPGFLAGLRALTRQHGVVLIFDEVVTGFRVGFGGAQAHFGVAPDLTTFGKIIGGGLPIGALGGPRHLMQRLAPEGDVYHGGTFAGHPLSMAAGRAALQALKARDPYARLDDLATELVSSLNDAASRAGVPVHINRVGSMFTLFFSDTPVKNFAAANAGRTERFARWANALRRQGILIPPSPFEALFVSTAHTKPHLERFIRAARVAFHEATQG